MAAVKISSDLERVGDLAVTIAEATQRHIAHPPVVITHQSGLVLPMIANRHAICSTPTWPFRPW